MKTRLLIIQKGIAIATLAVLFQSCSSVAPVTTSVETARLVEKGKIEAAVMYSNYKEKVPEYKYYFDSNGGFNSEETGSKMETMNNNYGMRIVIGGNQTNVGFHYEKLVAKGNNFTVNYFSIEPKFRIASSKKSASAFSIPIGIYIPDEDGESPVYQLMPSFHLTYGGSKYFEFNFSPKMLMLINHSLSPPFLNLTSGFSFSSDLSKWAIRPEIGYTAYLGGEQPGILQTAVGLSFKF